DEVRNWSMKDINKAGIRPLEPPRSPHFFSSDFTRYARIDNAMEIRIDEFIGKPALLTLRRESEKTLFHAVSFSPDNRWALVGATEVPPGGGGPGPGRVMLVDLKSGAVIAVTEPTLGVPDRLQLRTNEMALVGSSQN